jgi:hypothetical protein
LTTFSTNFFPSGLSWALAPISTPNCRTARAPSDAGDCGCCTYTAGQEGDFQKLQDAIDALP